MRLLEMEQNSVNELKKMEILLLDLQLHDIDACTFLVELRLNRPFPTRVSDFEKWETIAALPYLDRELSPAMNRSFFIPYVWQGKNVFGNYNHRRKFNLWRLEDRETT